VNLLRICANIQNPYTDVVISVQIHPRPCSPCTDFAVSVQLRTIRIRMLIYPYKSIRILRNISLLCVLQVEEEPLHPFIDEKEEEPLYPFIDDDDDPLHAFIDDEDEDLPNESDARIGPMLPFDAAVPGALGHAFDLHNFHLSDLRKPLHPGCSVSMLGLIQRVVALQTRHKASDKHSEDVMSLCHELTDPPHPRTYRQAKTIMEKTCMSNCTQIPACPDDHIVFYNSPFDPEYQYADLDECPQCGASKLDLDGNPVRVFHHIPLGDHVEAIFCLKDVVERFERRSDRGHVHGGNMSYATCAWRERSGVVRYFAYATQKGGLREHILVARVDVFGEEERGRWPGQLIVDPRQRRRTPFFVRACDLGRTVGFVPVHAEGDGEKKLHVHSVDFWNRNQYVVYCYPVE
jgi:hypothetical protein